MPSFRQLCSDYESLLIIDAASASVQVGACVSRSKFEWETSEEEAGIGVFQCIEKLSIQPEKIRAFVYCHGPGSILGIRTVAMAIRTWHVFAPRPVFAYESLALVAHALGCADISVIADARRDAWHHFQIGRGLRRVPSTQLEGTLVMPDQFRAWSPLPPEVGRIPYNVAALLDSVMDHDLFGPADEPDAFLHEEPSYATWTPHVHQAPPRREK